MATLKTEKPVDKATQQVECPNCLRRGTIRARLDAYADHTVTMDGKKHFDNTNIFFETAAVYECGDCAYEPSKKELEDHNGIQIE